MASGAYAIIWRYEVEPAHREAFEAGYGPAGEWARLFAAAPGFIRTELMAGGGGCYATIDYWRCEADFRAFQTKSGAEYRALDRKCEPWMLKEERIGAFTVLEAPER